MAWEDVPTFMMLLGVIFSILGPNHRDRRFKTGWRNNDVPPPLNLGVIGTVLLVIGFFLLLFI